MNRPVEILHVVSTDGEPACHLRRFLNQATMPQQSLSIRPPRPDETARVVDLLTAGESEMRRHLMTASVTGALSNSRAKTIGLVVEVDNRISGAAIASALPGGSGVLIGLRVERDMTLASVLFDRVAEYLQALDVTFVQGTCDPDCPIPEFAAIGFEHLADLTYLSTETSALAQITEAKLTFADSNLTPEPELVALLEQTYQGSLDCPSMSGYRSAAESLASYRASAFDDPSAWQVASLDGRPVGCVFTLPFAESQTLELTYMGIIPEARGQGLGRELVAKVVDMATNRELETISLGVDQQNLPAQQIYSTLGFKPFFGESVWGRRIVTSVS